MKSKNLVLLLFTFLSITLTAQEWNSLAPNVLHAENSANNVSPIHVGIGTSTPATTTVLHTVGDLRFQNVTANDNVVGMLGVLANGDVRQTSGAWLLNGNNNVAAANFIGTINNQDFRIRTNNVQKMVVTTGGNVGINSIAGQAFHVPTKLIDARFLSGAAYNPATDALNGILLYNRNLANLANGQGTSITFAAVGPTDTAPAGTGNQAKATISGVVSGIDSMDIVFQNEFDSGTGNQGSMRESMRITSGGFVGIGTNAPAVQFHTTGEVQFDGLPGGSGCYLALDNNNRVVVTSDCSMKPPGGDGSDGGHFQKIIELEDRINKLEALLMQQMEMKSEGRFKLPASSKAMLYQNAPNPFNEITRIGFFIPEEVDSAILNVFDVNGRTIKTINIQERGNAEIEIVNSELSSGVYSYSLITDGEVIATKKMIATASN